MARLGTRLGTSLLLLALACTPLRAGTQELKTVELATEAVRAFAEIPLKGIPRSLLRDAAGVAVIPHLVKAGLLIDGRFGRGVILVHRPDGGWSNPLFVSMSGAGIGGEAGIESTELVLVFQSAKSLDKALRGKLTLGGDIAVAAGPVGRDAELATDRRLKTDIYSYSRSRGLFVGVSLEGSRLRVEPHANEAFYGLVGGRPEDVLAYRGVPLPAAEALRALVASLSASPPPFILSPPVAPPLYPAPPPPPPRSR